MNYAVQDHPKRFLGFGLLLCTLCSSKHCMIYQRLETACMTAAGSPQRRGTTCIKVFGCSELMLDGIGSVCMSEVISANMEAAVKSCLARRKRQQSKRNTRVASLLFAFPLYPLLHPPFKCNFPPLTVPYISIALALFWFTAPVMRYRGDVMQVCTHECLSRNFTLYFSHVRGQCGAGIDWAYS